MQASNKAQLVGERESKEQIAQRITAQQKKALASADRKLRDLSGTATNGEASHHNAGIWRSEYNREPASDLLGLSQLNSPLDFGAFWESYPRKVGKAKAEKIWRKLPLGERLQARKGVAMWRQAEQWHQAGGKFIPYASTYLAQRRWDDEPWPGAREEFGLEVRNVLE